MSRVLTFVDVAKHNSRQDLYIVVYNKVYDISNFVDDHPGGEEILLEFAGQDATEAYVDAGHSKKARESLDDFLIGQLRRVPGDPPALSDGEGLNKITSTASKEVSSAGMESSMTWYALFLFVGFFAYGTFRYYILKGKHDFGFTPGL